jgi:hypothetical protein
MKKLISILMIAVMLSGCSVMEKLANPDFPSTTPPKPEKIYKTGDPIMSAAGIIGLGGAMIYVACGLIRRMIWARQWK